MHLLGKNDRKYIWNDEWVLEGESFWGIIQRFKYFNCIDKLNSKYFKLKAGNTEKADSFNYIIRKNIVYNPAEYADFFGISSNHYQYLLPFKDNDIADYIDTSLKFCPKCIQHGYHSYIHQFLFETKCFIHSNTPLTKTKANYIISNYAERAFTPILDEEITIPTSDTMLLNTIYNKNRFKNKFQRIHSLQNAIIINLSKPSRKLVNPAFPMQLSKYLHCVFWGTNSPEEFTYLHCISKSKVEDKWKTYNYTRSNPFSHIEKPNGTLSDYCCSFIESIFNSISEETFKKTLSIINSSYVTSKYYPEYMQKYDYDAISVIITIAIITDTPSFSTKSLCSLGWPRRQVNFFLESEFENRIANSQNNGIKIAYIELYKIILQHIYEYIKTQAYNDSYTGKNELEFSYRVEFPVYVITEDLDNIYIHAFYTDKKEKLN